MAIEKISRLKGTTYRAVIRRHRIKLSRTFSRRVDAECWEREQLVRGRSEPRDRNTFPNTTLIELRERFVSQYSILRQAPSTIKLESGIFNKHVAPFLGAAKVRDLRASDIEDLFGRLAHKSVSIGRINRVRTLLNTLLNQGVRWGMLMSNPIQEVPRLPGSSVLEKSFAFLSQEEARTLLDSLETSNVRMYRQIRVLLNCGLRYGEMAALRVRDVSLTPQGGFLRVCRTFCRHTLQIRPRTKGGKSRVIPLSLSMAKFLGELANGKGGDDPLLWNSWKEANDPWRFAKVFRAVLQDAGLRRIRIHDLRHSFAVHFLERGGHLYDLQKLLGHSSSKLTERYSHFSSAMVERSCGIVDHHGQSKPQLVAIDGGVRSVLSHKCPTEAPELSAVDQV